MLVSFVFAYVHLLHRIIDKGEHEKHLLLPLYGNTEGSLVTARAYIISERLKGNQTSFSVVSNILQSVDSM